MLRPRFASAARWSLALTAALGAILSAGRVRACASCGCGDPTLTAAGLEQPYANRVRASLGVQHRVDTIGAGADELRLSEQRLDAQLAWAPHPRLFLIAGLPVLWRDVTYAETRHRSTEGVGDAELRAKVFVYRDRAFAPRHLVALTGGVKLPTGTLQRRTDGRLYPIELQPGTGSTDLLAGVSHAFFAFPWSSYASAQLLWPTAGMSGYRGSRSLRGTLAGQRHLGTAVAVRLAAEARLDGRARENGAMAPDSGGLIGFVTPELLVTPVTDLTVSAFVRVAVLNRLEGAHREPFVVGGAVAYDF
jgi:hypothetical protein